MADSFQPWEPTFADSIGEEFDSDEDISQNTKGYGTSSGRKRVGSDHDGMCRRPPVHAKRR